MEETLQPAALTLSASTRDFLAGGVSGLSGVVAGQPLDNVRIRQQQRQGGGGAGAAPPTRGRQILAGEGPRALFRGMAYPLLTSALQNALVFQTYGAACRCLGAEADGVDPGAESALPLGRVAAAGAAAGFLQTAVCTPVELLKIRLQLQTAARGSPGYVGALDQALRIWRGQGISGLYLGAGMTAARDVPSFAAYFCTFEAVRRACESSGSVAAPPTSTADALPGHGCVLAAGAAAGLAAWLAVYPLDVVKSRLQAHADASAPGAWRIAADMAAREGPRAFFRGLPATLGRALLVNAVIFSVYEGAHTRLAAI
ncbi:hypothetical protein APUTEX25_000984 [Auxenochlorella protothecoides]|uniref:Mitochondrial arginine transporter BAC2 n=1 Tax=Auxenochlorella protothecoides TaxID=3075 RepID=A0A3M7KT36_AUXPR|nr:hypothetical protein APUTEX25_000984 [Auxenochlorella protothecoides]|eukprot:RMZ52865.1 hypothetical protein APUTEX25_000984 [Auxenochlorella protothecoides]